VTPPPPDPHRVRALLFDKDGTLTDFRATWEGWLPGALDALAAESGTSQADLSRAIGMSPDTRRFTSDSLFVTAPGDVTAAALANVVGWPASEVRTWMATRAAEVRQVAAADLPALFRRLRATGRPLGVLTNADEAEARRHLDALGVLPHLTAVIGCDSGYGAKPDPGGALAFAAELGLDPAEIALVGDSQADIGAARAAGMVAIGVATGTRDAADLAGEVDVVLPSVADLPAWLDGDGRRRSA
jgi:phosphoglycolate phosphatase